MNWRRWLIPSKKSWRVILLLLLAGNAAAAVAWLYAMPHGFPVGHARFWLNTVGPMLVLVWFFSMAIAGVLRRGAVLNAMLLMLPSGYISAAVTGIIVFPYSGWAAAFVVMATAVLAAGAIAWSGLWNGRLRFGPSSAFAATIAILIGLSVPWLLRGPHAGTRP
jgi:hypothetical protein